MERRKRLFSHEVKRTRLEMQEFMCGGCGQDMWKKPSGYTQGHHIVPHSLGGTLEPENLVILCPSCHVDADNAVMLHGTIYGGYHLSEADSSQRNGRK